MWWEVKTVSLLNFRFKVLTLLALLVQRYKSTNTNPTLRTVSWVTLRVKTTERTLLALLVQRYKSTNTDVFFNLRFKSKEREDVHSETIAYALQVLSLLALLVQFTCFTTRSAKTSTQEKNFRGDSLTPSRHSVYLLY